jgi:hypothetical protein
MSSQWRLTGPHEHERRSSSTWCWELGRLTWRQSASITSLTQLFPRSLPLCSQDLPCLARELQSLIGSFDLDPNRCLDLLLDAAAAQPLNTALLEAVGLLKAEAVGQLMGFKLEQYQVGRSARSCTGMMVSEGPPLWGYRRHQSTTAWGALARSLNTILPSPTPLR